MTWTMSTERYNHHSFLIVHSYRDNSRMIVCSLFFLLFYFSILLHACCFYLLFKNRSLCIDIDVVYVYHGLSLCMCVCVYVCVYMCRYVCIVSHKSISVCVYVHVDVEGEFDKLYKVTHCWADWFFINFM